MGLHTRTAVARLPLRQLGFLVFIFLDRSIMSPFLPARRYASAGLCDSDVSGRPSVRLSVTRRYCA